MSLINLIFGAFIFALIVSCFIVTFFRRYKLRIPIYILAAMFTLGLILSTAFNMNIIRDLGNICSVIMWCIVLLEYGLDQTAKIRYIRQFIFINRGYKNEPEIALKNIFKSRINKSVFIFMFIFIPEQIFAYTMNLDFFKYSISTRYGQEITSSSLVIPLGASLLYYLVCKVLIKIKSGKLIPKDDI